jgi:hypothetical protein
LSVSVGGTNLPLNLTGTGVQPVLKLNVAALHFGSTAAGTTKSSTMTLYNYTATPVISTIGTTGSSAFTVGPDNCSGTSLASNTYCNFTVNFAPGSSTGVLLSGSITVTVNSLVVTSATVDGTGK